MARGTSWFEMAVVEGDHLVSWSSGGVGGSGIGKGFGSGGSGGGRGGSIRVGFGIDPNNHAGFSPLALRV